MSVKPTKNPCKFIFETEMSADELAHLIQAEFPNNYECIVSIKPTGLWKNKLFVTVHESYLDSDNLNTMATILNKKLEAEEAKSHLTYLIAYKVPGYLGERFFVNEQTARKFANACSQKKQVVYHEQRGYYAEHITLIRNDETGEQLWPRETEKLWCIMFQSAKTNRVTTLLNTKQYAENVIADLKAYGCGTINLSNFEMTMNDSAYVYSVKVFNEKFEQIWPRENKNSCHVTCCDTSTENGNDMLKDVLKKPEDDKCGCVIGPEWKYPVKKSSIPKLISMLNDTNIRMIDIARSEYGPVSVFKTAILEVKDENNEIIWRKKSEDTSFKAPSLLSRIY